MSERNSLVRIRWGVRVVLFLGVAASIAGNVLHAQDTIVSQIISAWSPLALLMTIELISRIPVHSMSLAVARWAATAVIAGIAAWVSYWHMAAVASRYGETGASPYLLPLSVDGLVVVASICLVELAGRIRQAEVSAPVSTTPVAPSQPRPTLQYAKPLGPEPAPVDKVSTPTPPPRKPHPSSKERIEKAHRRTPRATNEQLAERLNLTAKTVQRWRPAREDQAPPTERINGNAPVLAGAHEKES